MKNKSVVLNLASVKANFLVAFRSRLCWKVALSVFLAIISIEAFVLIPSYLRQEKAILTQMENKGRVAVVSAFSTDRQFSTLTEFDRVADIFGISDIVGVVVFEGAKRLAGLGQEPNTIAGTFDAEGIYRQKSTDGNSYSFGWHLKMPGSESRKVFIRTDTRTVSVELREYVYRILGLVLIIAIFTTIATMLALWWLVLRPLLDLKALCGKANDPLGFKDASDRDLARLDEIGDLYRAFQITMKLNSLSAEKSKVANENLELQVAKRTRDLNETNQRLNRQIVLSRKSEEEAERANKSKSEFLSSMSHELRTPMNSIIGFSQMLDRNALEPLTSTQQKCVDHILRGGRHLLDLINEILDLSKVESGKMDLGFEHVFPSSVFKECVDLLRGHASARDITLSGNKESDAGILVDRFRFKQVILNLLSNAIKYNNDGGKVSFGCVEQPDGIVRIFVSDTGPGIPDEMIPDLFVPFERLHYSQSEIEGTGIGLTISKRLVEVMGGTIGCDSKVGEGTTFWLEFPKVDADVPVNNIPVDAVEVLAAPAKISGTMLYIEDDMHNTALMELIVTRIENVSMISAPTAELGIEMACSVLPDVIVLDINLPGMDGFEAIAQLKKIDKTRDIPVIALSAAAMSHDIERGKKAGFLHYLTKPIDIDEVISVIGGVIGAKEL